MPRDYDEGWRNFQDQARSTLEPWNLLSEVMLAFFDHAFHKVPAKRASVADIQSFAAEHWVRECSALRGPEATDASAASAVQDAKDQKKQTESEFAVLEALRPARNATPHWVANVRAIDSKNHHKFQIIVIGPSEHTKAGRMICIERYSRLLGFHRECSSHHPGVTPTNFPKKKVLGRMHSKFVISRAEGLAEYFEDAMQHEECRAFWASKEEMIVVSNDAAAAAAGVEAEEAAIAAALNGGGVGGAAGAGGHGGGEESLYNLLADSGSGGGATAPSGASSHNGELRKWTTMADTTFQISPLDVEGFEALPYQSSVEPTMPNVRLVPCVCACARVCVCVCVRVC